MSDLSDPFFPKYGESPNPEPQPPPQIFEAHGQYVDICWAFVENIFTITTYNRDSGELGRREYTKDEVNDVRLWLNTIFDDPGATPTVFETSGRCLDIRWTFEDNAFTTTTINRESGESGRRRYTRDEVNDVRVWLNKVFDERDRLG